MEILIHIANCLYLASYVMRDVLWLRLFTVIAATCLVGYFYFNSVPILPVIYWNLFFILLNLCWIIRLILERRPPQADEDGRRPGKLAFDVITPDEAMLRRSMER